MKRIKYISRFSRPHSARDIEELVRQSAESNKAREVTGLLITAGGVFFQIIEGPKHSVDELYLKIRSDPRHIDVVLLAEEEVDRRLFPDWSMGKMDLDAGSYVRTDSMKAIMESITGLQMISEKLAKALEIAAWDEASEKSK
jgi:hypothetical protein